MSDIQFEDQSNEFGAPPSSAPATDWTGKLVEWGFVANREQAQYAMVGILVAVLALTAFVYFRWL